MFVYLFLFHHQIKLDVVPHNKRFCQSLKFANAWSVPVSDRLQTAAVRREPIHTCETNEKLLLESGERHTDWCKREGAKKLHRVSTKINNVIHCCDSRFVCLRTCAHPKRNKSVGKHLSRNYFFSPRRLPLRV